MLKVRLAGLLLVVLVGLVAWVLSTDRDAMIAWLPAIITAVAFSLVSVRSARASSARWRVAGCALAMAVSASAGWLLIPLLAPKAVDSGLIVIGGLAVACLVHAGWALTAARKRVRKRLFDNYLLEREGGR